MAGRTTLIAVDEFDLVRNCGGFRSSCKALGAKTSALRSRAALASTASTDTSVALAMPTGTSTRILMTATKKLLGFRTEGSHTHLTPAPMRPDIAIRVIRAHSPNDAGAGSTALHVEAVSSAVVNHVLSVHADNKRTAKDRAAGEKRDVAQNAADAEIILAKKHQLQLLLAQLQGDLQNSDGAKHINECIAACEAEAAQLNKNKAAIEIQCKATNASTLLCCQTKAILQKLIDGPRSVAGTCKGNTVRKEFVARQATDPDLDLSIDCVTGDENQNEKRRSLEVVSAKTGGVVAGTSAVTIGTNMPTKLGLAFGAQTHVKKNDTDSANGSPGGGGPGGSPCCRTRSARGRRDGTSTRASGSIGTCAARHACRAVGAAGPGGCPLITFRRASASHSQLSASPWW